MITMLDALLAALPDSAYFDHRHSVEALSETLRTSEEPFACYLRGPSVWNTVTHPAYPFYSLCKSNTVDNPIFAPYQYGSIVISSIETGELLIYLAEDFGGKTPEEPSPVPAKPKSTLPRAKTYSVDDHWRMLDLKDLHGGFGNYHAFMHVGNFQSQAYAFQVVPDPAHPKLLPYAGQLKEPAQHDTYDFGIAGASVSQWPSVQATDKAGVTLVQGKATTLHGKHHYPIHGTFRFSGEWPTEYVRLPLHFLISGKDSRELLVKTLWLPRSKCQIQTGPDGYYSGQFDFGLENLFITPGDGKSKTPKEAWISTVHRGWQGSIVKYEFDVLH